MLKMFPDFFFLLLIETCKGEREIEGKTIRKKPGLDGFEMADDGKIKKWHPSRDKTQGTARELV